MVDSVETNEIRFVIDSNQAETRAKGLRLSFTELNQAFELVRKGFNAAGKAADILAGQLDQGAKVNNLTRAFDTLQTSAGLLASESLAKLQQATQGLVSDLDLLQASNQAVQLGLDPAQLDVYAEAALKLGRAVGRDAKDAFDDLITGVGRASPLILDNLGITVKAEQAYLRWSAANGVLVKDMTAAQKTIAFQEAALEAITRKSEQLGDATLTAGDAAQQVRTTYENLTNTFAGLVSENEALGGALQELNKSLNDIDVEQVAARFAEFFTILVKIADKGIPILVQGLEDVIRGFKVLQEIDPARLFLTFGKEIENAQRIVALKELADNLVAFGDATEGARNEVKIITGFFNSFAAGNDIAAETVLELRKRLEEYRNVSGITAKQQDDLNVILDEGERILANLGKFALPKASEEVGGLGDNSDEARKKFEKLADEFDKFEEQVLGDKLSREFEEAVEKLDEASLETLKDEILNRFAEGLEKGAEKYIGTKWEGQAKELVDIAVQEEERALDNEVAEKRKEIAEQHGEDLKEAYQQSVDFWRDIFQNAITGATFDLEDALKQVAVGFAAEMAAAITGISFQGGPQGLGGALAQGILGKPGSLLGGVFGGGGGAGGLVPIGQNVDGTLIFGPASAGAGFGLASIVPGAGVLGGLFAANESFNSFQAGDVGGAGLFGAIAGGIGIGGLAAGATSLFGGGASQAELDRRKFREELEALLGGASTNLSFGESQSIFDIDFANFEDAAQQFELVGEAANVVSAIVTTLAGNNEELRDSFTGVFAQLVTGFEDGEIKADSMNEVILNTRNLMYRLDLTAGEVSATLTNAFLDGQISLEEFGAGLEAVNLLAQDNLVGEGSIGDAVDILAKSIEENPLLALQALEFAFVEAAEVAGNEFEAVQQYFVERFGPESIAIFEKLKMAGIDSFEDLKSANENQIFAIFSALEGFAFDTVDTFDEAGTLASIALLNPLQSAAQEFQDGFSSASQTAVDEFVKETDRARKQIGDLTDDIRHVNGEAGTLLKKLDQIPSEKTINVNVQGTNSLNQA